MNRIVTANILTANILTTQILITAGIIGTLGTGCGDTNTTNLGTAEISIFTSKAFPGQLTRITVETDSGFSTDLFPDANSKFTGSLFLPSGVHQFVGKAFIDTEQVGESSPVSAEIVVGVVSEVMFQIIDTTSGEQPDFSPILTSLTHPESTIVGVGVMFAASIVDLDGDPVAIEWSDDCEDAGFTDPTAAITEWSKATPGICRINLFATSNDRILTASFQIVVFEPGVTGAAEVTAEFLSVPFLSILLSGSQLNCNVFGEQFSDASCAGSVASPERLSFSVSAAFTGIQPASLDIADNCGGTFTLSDQPDAPVLVGEWLPPVNSSICVLTAQATTIEGADAALSAAVLVLDGTPREEPPFFDVVIFNGGFGACGTDSEQAEPIFCGTVPSVPTPLITVEGFLDFFDAVPDSAGSVEFTDDCGGTFEDTVVTPLDYATRWVPPTDFSGVCKVTVSAINSEGTTSQASGLIAIEIP